MRIIILFTLFLGIAQGFLRAGQVSPPSIQAFVQVVQYSNLCGVFNPVLTNQHSATAFQSAPNVCPDFCFRVTVKNTGGTILNNVMVTSSLTDLGVCFPTPFTLQPAGQPNSSVICISALVPLCTNALDIVTATGTGTGAVVVSSQDTNSVTIVPFVNDAAIQVYRQVVLYSNVCRPFDPVLTNQHSAMAFQSAPNVCPDFCYRVVVTNTGIVTLTNVMVSDSLVNLGLCFPTPITLAPGGQPNSSAACIISTVPLCTNALGIATATGTGPGAVVVSSQDTNSITVVPFVSNAAIQVYRQVVLYSNVCRPFAPVLTNQHSAIAFQPAPNVCPDFCYRVVVTNTGSATLTNVMVADSLLNLGACFPVPITLAPAGQPNSAASCIISDVALCTNELGIAMATGTGPGAAVVSSQDTNLVTIISYISNKVVECGTAWNFHTPNVTNILGDTLTVIVSSTVTNSSCGGTFSATRTWEVLDDAGDTATGSQTVVVVDTMPPAIVCPSPITLEFTDTNGAVANFAVTATDKCSAVSLSVSPSSGTTFPIGVTTVNALATDSCGNSNFCSFTVTVLGAMGVKSNVLAQLLAIQATNMLSQPVAGKLSDAIQNLQNSLNPSYWIDQTHLQPKLGSTAINDEKLAAADLSFIMGSNKSPVDPAVVQDMINRIIKADRLLAIISIQGAAAAGLNARKIAEDTAMVAKGDQAASNGHYADAIEDYRNAWNHSLQMHLQTSVTSTGSAQLQFIGNGAASYVIEVSTNLLNWVPLGTYTPDVNDNVEFIDTNAVSSSGRFYRVVQH